MNTDDQKIAYRAAISGTVKNLVNKNDIATSYEPQMDDHIPENFLVLELSPAKVDQTILAPPAVIADQRRKPQQYESLA